MSNLRLLAIQPAKMHAGKNGRKSVEESPRPEAPGDDDVTGRVRNWNAEKG